MLVPAHAQNDDENNNFIVAGQPIFIIVIGEYCGIPNNLGTREEAELAKNFKSLNPKIRYAWISTQPLTFDNYKHSTIHFDNEEGKGCVRVVYWDGKKSSTPLLYNDLVGATEYFSPKLLKKKVESSYYTEFQKRLKHFQQKKEHLTSRSKEVSDRYVKDVLINQALMLSPVFSLNLKNVKCITVKENKQVQMRLCLNEQGLLSRIERQDGEVYMECKYEDGLLRELVEYQSDAEPLTTTQYLYNDNEIFKKVVKEETPPYDGKHFYYSCDYYQLQDDFLNCYRTNFSTDTWSIYENIIKREGNKIIDETDTAFITAQLGQAPAYSIGMSNFVRRLERGEQLATSDIEPTTAMAVRQLLAAVAAHSRDDVAMRAAAVKAHIRAAQNWPKAKFPVDLLSLLPPQERPGA